MSPGQQDNRTAESGEMREEAGTSAYTHPPRILGDDVGARARLAPLTRTLHVESAILLALSLSYLCWRNHCGKYRH